MVDLCAVGDSSIRLVSSADSPIRCPALLGTAGCRGFEGTGATGWPGNRQSSARLSNVPGLKESRMNRPLCCAAAVAVLLAGCGTRGWPGPMPGRDAGGRPPVGRVTGRLLLEGGPMCLGGRPPGLRPIRGVLTRTTAGRKPAVARAGRAGVFSVRLPGRYRVSARPPARGRRWKRAAFRWRPWRIFPVVRPAQGNSGGPGAVARLAPRAWQGGHGRPCGTSRKTAGDTRPATRLTGETRARVTRLGGLGGTVGRTRDDLPQGWIGPVGLAETNSRLTRRPASTGPCPQALPCSTTMPAAAPAAARLSRMFKDPGPAIARASSRGGTPAFLATRRASAEA
jgi:hypothetical protein